MEEEVKKLRKEISDLKKVISDLDKKLSKHIVFIEEVYAVNRQDAVETAKARNPKARLIGVNPNLKGD